MVSTSLGISVTLGEAGRGVNGTRVSVSGIGVYESKSGARAGACLCTSRAACCMKISLSFRGGF